MMFIQKLAQGMDTTSKISLEQVNAFRAQITAQILSDEPYCWTIEKFYSSASATKDVN